MAIPKITGAQRDFSGGELDVSMKRADENPIMKIGARQLSNYRILSSGAAKNRPGRTALFSKTGRVEEILMSPGNIFYLIFGAGFVQIFNAAGVSVFSSAKKGDGATNIPWTAATLKNIDFVVVPGLQYQIYITYADDAPVNVPQVLSWDGISQTSTWTLTTYAETITAGGQKLTLFYRVSPPNIVLAFSAAFGPGVTVSSSSPLFVAGMIGTRMRYLGRQFLIMAFTDNQHVTANVEQSIPPDMVLTTGASLVGIAAVGDEIIGATSGAHGIILAVTAAPNITVQVIPISDADNAPAYLFVANEVIAGPAWAATLGAGVSSGAPGGTAIWDDEVMNNFRGWPAAVFYDQSRLGLNNFPSVPSGIAWGAIGLPADLLVGALPDDAIFELAPAKSQVFFVVPGMEGSEFVFTDTGNFYLPITPQNPLVPGSVAFTRLSNEGCAPNVKPKAAGQSILYVKSGGVGISAVQTPGAYFRPHIVDNVSEFHSHLFIASTPIAIAVQIAPSQAEETYAYVLLANGNIVMGKYGIKQGLLDVGPEGKPKIGWLPWSGAGVVTWISALAADMIFTTTYNINGTPIGIVERLDNTQYLDGVLAVNNLPAPFVVGGKGPLYAFPGPGGNVTLMDQSTRMMGTYQIDANGNIIPQNNGGENLLAATLVAGQPWTATLEPFVPDAQPGQSVHQRMFKRRVSRMAIYVSQSTGFLMARLFSGPLTRTSPVLGTIMNTHRVTTWNQDDDPTLAPPLREEAQRWRPLGRTYDPRVAVIKDLPGPLIVHEIGIEASI